jgi:hypothetical protein
MPTLAVLKAHESNERQNDPEQYFVEDFPALHSASVSRLILPQQALAVTLRHGKTSRPESASRDD